MSRLALAESVADWAAHVTGPLARYGVAAPRVEHGCDVFIRANGLQIRAQLYGLLTHWMQLGRYGDNVSVSVDTSGIMLTCRMDGEI